jgi:hypothetical protein
MGKKCMHSQKQALQPTLSGLNYPSSLRNLELPVLKLIASPNFPFPSGKLIQN